MTRWIVCAKMQAEDTQMKIMRDQQSKFWVLTSNSRVLYKGRRSPWDDPSIIRQALARERQLSRSSETTPQAS
jgi:hypothetical protein